MKKFFGTLIIINSLLYSTISTASVTVSREIKKEDWENFLLKNGRDRMLTILYTGDHGVQKYNQNITYAKIKNLQDDLVLPEIALKFPTHTEIGQHFLFTTLAQPINPADKNNIVSNRQAAIKIMVENQAIYLELFQLLAQAKEHEQMVIKLLMNRNQALQMLKDLDLSGTAIIQYILTPWSLFEQYRQTNPLVNLYGQAQNALFATANTSFVIPNLNQVYKIYTDPDFTWTNSKKADYRNDLLYGGFKKHGVSFEAMKHMYNNIGEASTINTTSKHAAALKNLAWGTASSLFFAYLTGTNVYQNYQQGIKYRDLLYALAQFIIIAEKIELICKNNNIPLQFSTQDLTDEKGKAMVQGLKHSRYQEKNSKIIATPWVNTFINEVYTQDNHLAPYFAVIAESDAYMAVAAQMVLQVNTPNKFCFSQHLPQKNPGIESHNFWNVLVTDAVPNSLQENRNIILTGPNAGGKSTIMRSIVQNIVLSQTFGIAAAETFAFTPFNIIESYLGIKDDITKKLSRFKAEIVTAQAILEQTKTLSADEKYFFIIDELFTGTGGKDGEIAAYEFITEDLAPYLAQTQFIFATHFDKLKEVEDKFPNLFANYKITPPIINTDGTLQYPFTMSKGANNTNVALLIKHAAGLTNKQVTPASI